MIFRKFFSFQLGNDAATIIGFWHNTIIDSHDKQYFYIVKTGSFDITNHHAVIATRNHAYFGCFKASL